MHSPPARRIGDEVVDVFCQEQDRQDPAHAACQFRRQKPNGVILEQAAQSPVTNRTNDHSQVYGNTDRFAEQVDGHVGPQGLVSSSAAPWGRRRRAAKLGAFVDGPWRSREHGHPGKELRRHRERVAPRTLRDANVGTAWLPLGRELVDGTLPITGVGFPGRALRALPDRPCGGFR